MHPTISLYLATAPVSYIIAFPFPLDPHTIISLPTNQKSVHYLAQYHLLPGQQYSR